MAFSRERAVKDGKPRYVALYRDLKGRQRSAGTFASERQADRAWQRAEVRVAQGQLGEPGRGRQTFRALRRGDLAAQPRDRGDHPAGATPTCCASTSCRSSGRCG